jgi:hypothetical protein
MKPTWGLIAASLFAGCATYSQYKCPDPIGEIVRQDCDDYRLRYESLQAKLSFSIGSVKVGAEVGKDRLRDPSELIQVMMHQMLTLCHDYNSCRVSNDNYRRRREEADRAFTAVMALLEQLKNPGLDPKNRTDLLEELFSLLKGSPPSTEASRTPTPQPEKKKPEEPRITEGFFRNPWGYWYNSKFNPPTPPPLAKGVPFILDLDPYFEKEQLSHFFVRLWGNVQEDDQFFVEGAAGEELRCPVTRKQNRPEGTATCRPEDKKSMPEGPRFKARYVPGESGKSHDLGVIDLNPELPGQNAWLAFQPDPVRADPVVRERPWLIVTTTSPKEISATARCFVDNKPLIVEGSGALKSINESSRYPKIRQIRFVIPLPYVLPYPNTPASEDEPLFAHAGSWRCKVSFDGEQALEVKFTIKKDGTPEPHPKQRGKSGDVASPWWLLENRSLKDQS